MGTTIRWLLLFLAALFLTALLEPLAVAELDRRGWYDNPGNAVGFIVNWIAQIVGEANFPWLAGGALGLAAGAWLDRFLRYLDNRVDPKLVALSERMVSFADKVCGTPEITQKENFFLLSIAAPIEEELERNGINLEAKVRYGSDADFLSRVASAYYRIAPLLKAGDIKSAKRITSDLNKIIEEKNA